MQAFLTIAVRAARKAGEFIVRESDKLRSEQSTSQDEFVAKVNHAAEKVIIDTLTYSYKDHAFLGQESGQIGESEYQWIITPIDGIENFVRQIPHWAISIALNYKGRTVIAVVYDPVKEELFTAVQGRGAQFNGKRIRASNSTTLENSLLATGYPHKDQQRSTEYSATFTKLSPLCASIRQTGSTALDLAYVAAARVDGFWQHGLESWSTTAGVLLVRESGGMVSDINGNPNYLEGNSILTANPKVFKSMLQIVNQNS